MHWLQTLDAGLFRFLNQSLSNSLFDQVMPWLSGNALFVPLVLVVAALVIWRYRLKGLLFVVMLALIVPLGDGLVCNTLKHAVGRPRPYVSVPETQRLVGKGNPTGSLPSAHAANWFAAAMIAWIYFRRSAYVMLPLAVAVSFSRVYNGVHYPSDVLAGAILGAGYAVAGVLALNTAWRWVGGKWFPLWWEKLPSLVPRGPTPERGPGPTTQSPIADSQSQIANRKSLIERHWLRAGYVLIGVLLLVRLGYLGSGTIELSGDEAYQWQWSKHLALSYFSKPPLIAYTQWLGTNLWGDNQFGVRFFSPLIAATLAWLMLRFFAREVSARAGFVLVLVVTATPLLAVGATLMTVDPLSVFFWTAAMLAGWHAIKTDAKTCAWLWVGLWMGLGFLSKYTALFQWLCWAVFFALWPRARIHLRRPGLYLALLVNLACALPVIIWNQQHGWITATHVAGNAKLNQAWQPTEILENFGTFVGEELGLLNPIFFVATAWAAIAFWRRFRHDLRLVYFFSMGAPVFLVYLGWTFHSRVLPNWIAPSILPLFCVMVIYWEARHAAGARFVKPFLIVALVSGLTGLVLLHDLNLIRKISGRSFPPVIGLAARVLGWKEVAEAVGDARAKLLAEGKPVFIIGGHYSSTSQIAFHLPEAKAGVPHDPLVYFRTTSHPSNQYFFWPGYRDRKGQNAIYVEENRRPNRPPARLVEEFESVTDLGLRDVSHNGRVFHTLQIFECRNLR